ncbi:hypothetical protein Vadar_031275 [Vaccinium darrowii]|uniref:Uncharacterized protein n=1 Tax=Vaccinium darrowii TaxID=229202 RepID=A0ACB7YID2_9ERIC|nr:hypothetical protein Vadar_031275 [Vaccinium darrowii]
MGLQKRIHVGQRELLDPQLRRKHTGVDIFRMRVASGHENGLVGQQSRRRVVHTGNGGRRRALKPRLYFSSPGRGVKLGESAK